MVIRALRRELGKKIEHVWIKGNQDDGVWYDQLGTSARHNVDADALATWFRDNLPTAPQNYRQHIPEELISVSIQGSRMSSNIEDSIRYHVNGYYLRQYLQSRKQWNDVTWQTVNFQALYKYRQTLSTSEQHWFIKAVKKGSSPLERRELERPE